MSSNDAFRENPLTGHVYLIHMPGGPVKIGSAYDPHDRFLSISGSFPWPLEYKGSWEFMERSVVKSNDEASRIKATEALEGI